MALISGSQTITTANLTDLLDGGASALHSHAIADDSIVEAKFDVSNGPSNDYFLQAQSAQGGGLTWAAAGGGLTSTVETFTQTASAVSSNTSQVLTGAGFAPKAALIFVGDGDKGAAWGFVDDANGGRNIYHNSQNSTLTTSIFSLSSAHCINVVNNTSPSNQLYASAVLTSNGITFTWNKSNSGVNVEGYVLYLG